MSFLSEYDAIPTGNPHAQVGLLFRWLQMDWRELFRELRASRPILVTPALTLVTRWDDVLQVLSQHQLFSVRGYAAKMDPSVGPFMLGRDETAINWHEKSVMRSLLRWDDLPGVRTMVGAVAAESLAGDGPVELVGRIGRLVPLRIVQRYFGFPGLDDATMLKWSKATQTDMFRNPTNDPQVHAANVQAGTEMRAYLRPFLATKANAADGSCPPDDVVSRLVRLARTGQAAMDAERLVSNVCGLLVGAIETNSQAIVQAIEQILLRQDVAARAIQAARAGDVMTFDPIVWEALRFNPITTLVLRYCERDAVLAPGTPHALPMSKGTLVAACIGSAMFDEAKFPDPDTFTAGRPFDTYLHFGFGHHECLGKYVGIVAIPETVRQVFLLPGIHLLPGNEGKIDFQNGPFPERFMIGREKASPPPE
jgi:cytochrome P450